MEGEQLQGRPDAAFAWFTQFQLHFVIKNGVIPEWFHGIITRKAAEELLLPKPPGYFLIRVSESRIGYTLSYRAEDRCRHFMIDALKDGYIIVGENTRHRLLQDLVDFHRRTPIRPFSELLTVPCGQMSDKADYAELLFPKRQPMKPDIGPPPNNSLHSNSSHLTPQEEPPPALPQRTNAMKNSAVPSQKATKMPPVPSSHPSNRLYPCLEEELPHLSVQTSAVVDTAKPIPVPRKIFLANLTQPDQAPELPARNSHPPQRKDQIFTNTSSVHDSPSSSKPAFTSERIVPLPTMPDGLQSSNAMSQPERNQDVKSSVAMSLMHMKKKFQKTKSISEEQMYSEINVEAEERHEGKLAALVPRDGDGAGGGQIENEYQELPGEQTVNSQPFPNARTAMRLADSELPFEYLQPPPFAPGY